MNLTIFKASAPQKSRKRKTGAQRPASAPLLSRRFQLSVLGLNSLAILLAAMGANARVSPSVPAPTALQGATLSGHVQEGQAVVACAAGQNTPDVLNQLNSALTHPDGLTVTLGARPDGQVEQRRIQKPFTVSQPTVFPDRNGNTFVCVSVAKSG
jgi:long-subunit acyl-CoA synthetase (AMP-forming)